MRLSSLPALLVASLIAACGTDPSLRAQREEDSSTNTDTAVDTGTGDVTEGSGDAADGSGADVIEDGSGDTADGSGSGDTAPDVDPAVRRSCAGADARWMKNQFSFGRMSRTTMMESRAIPAKTPKM